MSLQITLTGEIAGDLILTEGRAGDIWIDFDVISSDEYAVLSSPAKMVLASKIRVRAREDLARSVVANFESGSSIEVGARSILTEKAKAVGDEDHPCVIVVVAENVTMTQGRLS